MTTGFDILKINSFDMTALWCEILHLFCVTLSLSCNSSFCLFFSSFNPFLCDFLGGFVSSFSGRVCFFSVIVSLGSINLYVFPRAIKGPPIYQKYVKYLNGRKARIKYCADNKKAQAGFSPWETKQRFVFFLKSYPSSRTHGNQHFW